MGFSADRKILEESGAELEVLSGCCGMAGNFGMEKGHREISVAVANNALLPALATTSAATVVLADGFSCRAQIADLAKRPSMHLAQLMMMGIHNSEVK
jgi:Fe-S oxidoreductase